MCQRIESQLFLVSRRLIIFLFALMYAGNAVAQQSEKVSVYFPFGESVLSNEARFAIDSAIYSGTISVGQSVQIIGYTDAVGEDMFNLQLSRKRATIVKTYLVSSGFRANQITLVIGKGESLATEPAKPGGNLRDRRVDIMAISSKVKVKTIPINRPKPLRTAPVAGMQVQPVKEDISKVAVGQTMVLENIYFYAGRHIVRAESFPALNALVESLRDHPDIRIRIEGHVCCIPASSPDAIDNDAGGPNLSINRAAAIYDYLLAHGIEKERLSYVGFGRRHPVVPVERTEEDANRNRRVEIRVME
jgi:outer membrane protein OmpA-like peptidoglycan-associated protein